MRWFAAACPWTRAARDCGSAGLLLGLLAIDTTGAISAPAIPVAAAYDLQQLRHTAFRPEDGAPGLITSTAQTADGFLWVATPTGLFRYDGARFDMQLSNRLPSPSVSALLAEADGSLWIGYTFGGVSVLRNGQVRDVSGGRLPPGRVKQFVRSSGGALWMATSTGLARLAGDQWQLIDDHDGYSGEPPDWLGSSGSQLLVVTPSAALLYSAASGHFERLPRAAGEAVRYRIPQGSTWRPDLHHTQEDEPNQTTLDSTGSLWVAGDQSLLRYRWSSGAHAVPREERFSTAMGLTASVTSIFEDREGNVWVGTEKGLERFSIPKLQRVVLTDDEKPLLIPGEHGDLWVGSAGRPTVRLSPDRQPIPSLGTGPTAAFRGEDGTLCITGRAGIFHYANGTILSKLAPPVALEQAPKPFAVSSFQSIALDADGAVWVSIAHAGLFRRDRDGWIRAEQRYRLPRGPAVRLLVDARRRLWIAYPDNQLAIIEGDRSRVFTAADGLNVGNLLALDVEESHAWIAGDRGVAVLTGTRFMPLRGVGNVDFRMTSGIAETREGELWLNAARGIYRIPSASVRRLLAGAALPADYEVFDSLDGLDSSVEILRPGPTLLRTQDGRLWFSRFHGVWSIDPSHILRNRVAPIVSIEAVVCHGTRYEVGFPMSLPTGSRNLQIDYTAVSLTHPERVHFHYRLLGVDEGWQDAGQRRQAYYTNLSPGHYEFQVMAANEDGIWSDKSAVAKFNVSPSFYQTLGFKIAAIVAVILVVALLFVIRLGQMKRRYRRGAEARHAERERIARDIHDTLLQGVQALLFRLQMWEDDPRIPESLRTEIAAVSRQTKSIVVESRERILRMRQSVAQPADLAESLTVMGNEAPGGKVAAFEVKVDGEAQSLTAEANEQLHEIAREAVRNAYQHAEASRIAVNLEYGKRSLLMSIADNGNGVESDIADGLVPSRHFGLMGMRERARQLGAQFRIHSKSKQGTRVEVIVPARAAFRNAFKWPWQRSA